MKMQIIESTLSYSNGFEKTECVGKKLKNMHLTSGIGEGCSFAAFVQSSVIGTCASLPKDSAASSWQSEKAESDKLREAIQYYFDVLEEVRGADWKEKPDHVLAKMINAMGK
jgi:hypothetical protein